MSEVLQYISGEVPGGIILLLFLLLVMNLAMFYLYHSSKLYSKGVYKRKAIRSNVLLLGVYLILWISLKPPSLPERVIVLPFQSAESVHYQLAEALQRELNGNLDEKHHLNRWEWIYQTANVDSFVLKTYREALAEKIGAAVIISGDVEQAINNIIVHAEIITEGKRKKITVETENYSQAAQEIVQWMGKNLNIFRKNEKGNNLLTDKDLTAITEAKINLFRGNYDQVINDFTRTDSVTLIQVCKAYLNRGIAALENKKQSTLTEEKIYPDFRRLLNLLIPYSKEGKDTAEMNIILARMYLHIKNYEMAEICLEKALTQAKYNPRIYYYISFLHDSRYREIGFSTRSDILERAVQLDPGYPNAVYEFAQQLYSSGTAAASHPNTENAIKNLRNFLHLNPNNDNILSLLGRIYLQSKYTLEAIEIYERLVTLLPHSAENHYNLGIGYYHKKEYQKAREQFNRALEINDYSDAYLYLGVIERHSGNRDKALYYYRERVKRKADDEDQYAKEAMRGIRVILNEIAEEEESEKNEDRSSGDQ